VGLVRDIKTAWVRLTERFETRPGHSVFTHPLPDFPLPRRVGLPEDLPHVAIATPCKESGAFLDTYFGLVDALDYPKDKLHLLMLEGDSTDDTYEQADRNLTARRHLYAGTRLIKLDLGLDLARSKRGRVNVQRERRAAIAACRNELLRAAMETPAQYVLFLDSDMAVVPPLALKQALAYAAPIMVANCLVFGDDRIFDRNNFRYTRPVSDRAAKYFVNGGIYQPPGGYHRHYPEPFTGTEVELLHAVGGTFLLIRRDVIEAGADFPEEPYQLHIETEGFALKAADLGFGSFMLPGLIVRHGPS
jgi:mannan polymerase complexes MNN9 subunit